MNRDKLFVEFPDENEINSAVKNIVDKGFRQKESFYSYLRNMYKQIGLKHIFRDITEIAFAVLLVLSVLIFIAINSKSLLSVDYRRVYAFVFMVSPILYLVVSLVSLINTKQKSTYEIEMTCKYNIYQIAAFRMLVFSIFCIIVNTFFVYSITAIYKELSFFMALILSVTSLFLFSTTFLFFIVKTPGKYTKYIVSFGWLMINLGLTLYSTSLYNLLLSSVSVYVNIGVIIICAFMYIKYLKKLITFRSVGGMI